jgi:putative sterol carrier protein
VSTPARTGRPQYAALKDLTEGGTADLGGTFQNMASMLAEAGFDGAIEYQIGDEAGYRTFAIRVAGGVPAVGTVTMPDAQLRMFMAEQTWRQIASGTITPADAFCDGLVRVQGDTAVGTALLKHLAGTPGRIGIC